ncbi:hypothetical protein Patl1_34203 [Pistacia atlantica]|uniref:Uncharacterized protein n=1 Tax=Pistacia atlantica TaxID=434234 RepID=A0ACC0ZRC0_9ROSI|nr:hypothetical protein Patl1_34203 [Pistacia atlantica]
MCFPMRPSRGRALMTSFTPPPPEVVDGWQPATEDQSEGSSSSSGGALFGIIMGGLIVLVIVLLVIVWFICGRKQRFKSTARNHRGNRRFIFSDTQQVRQQEQIPVANYDNISENDKEILDWKKRFNIAVGTAKGLVHLHDGCDYIDPDFFTSGIKLNEKSDVYSFGMLLLELITGCLPVNKIKPSDPDYENLAVKAKPMLRKAVKDDNINVVYTDPKLRKKFDNREMFRMVHCAAACVCYPARDRPQMTEILAALEGNLDVKRLTEKMKTMLDAEAAEHILRDNKKLLEMLKAIAEEDPASSTG